MITNDDLKTYLEWDYLAWGEALKYWDDMLPESLTDKKVLELGGRNGGLSIYFAKKGASVTCSDINGPSSVAIQKHKELNLKNVKYENIDATNIPFKDEFDYIVFKSILGGIGYNDNIEAQSKAIHSCFNALKPNGKLLFAENGKASILHQILRKKATAWGGQWRYLTFNELNLFLNKNFKRYNINSFGFFSIFTRSLFFKKVFYYIDKSFAILIPKTRKYILYGIAEK
jgi:ubiquinone/menaquinone biosynthesis C-methylase UbiE